jgi:hypothetical protein
MLVRFIQGDIMDNIVDMMILLGYHVKWLEYGFIDLEIIENQVKVYKSSGDINTEHYRLISFRNLLKNRTDFPKDFIDKYIDLALCDGDELLGRSVIVELIDHENIDKDSLVYIASDDRLKDKIFVDRIDANILSISLQKDGNMGIDICKYLRVDNRRAQDVIVSKTKNIHVLELLSEKGTTKSIRNRAKIKLLRVLKEN